MFRRMIISHHQNVIKIGVCKLADHYNIFVTALRQFMDHKSEEEKESKQNFNKLIKY